jgi:hypothetical protein
MLVFGRRLNMSKFSLHNENFTPALILNIFSIFNSFTLSEEDFVFNSLLTCCALYFRQEAE